jgi:hypothetical protein
LLDLTGLPAIDLAIGLGFIFFLLSTLAATIQEFIAAILGLRARTLEQGLRSLLEDPEKGWKYVDEFYEHDLIRSLYRTPPPEVLKAADEKANAKPKPQPVGSPTESREPSGPDDAQSAAGETRADVAVDPGKNAYTQSRGWFKRGLAFFKRTGGPSYVSPRSFAIVVLDNLAPDKDGKTIFDKGNKVLDELPEGIRKRLKPLLGGPQRDVETLRTNLEAWYDDTMARVSGWYKRKTQIILIVIGIALVPAINANAIKMGERMWKDDTVRAAVVAQAQAIASPAPTATPGEPNAATTPSPDAQELSEAAGKLKAAADDVDQVVQVGIPMGWRGDAVPEGAGEIAVAIGGWLLTILAISLGAPFWFDTLGRLSRLRSSGKPETPLPATGSGKANERILTPPQVPTVELQHEPAPTGTSEPRSGSSGQGEGGVR